LNIFKFIYRKPLGNQFWDLAVLLYYIPKNRPAQTERQPECIRITQEMGFLAKERLFCKYPDYSVLINVFIDYLPLLKYNLITFALFN
jgi:hypothetical protein